MRGSRSITLRSFKTSTSSPVCSRTNKHDRVSNVAVKADTLVRFGSPAGIFIKYSQIRCDSVKVWE